MLEIQRIRTEKESVIEGLKKRHFDASEIVQSWFMDETSNQGKISLHGVVSFCKK